MKIRKDLKYSPSLDYLRGDKQIKERESKSNHFNNGSTPYKMKTREEDKRIVDINKLLQKKNKMKMEK